MWMAEMSYLETQWFGFKFHFYRLWTKTYAQWALPTHPFMTTSQTNCRFQSFRNPKLSEEVGGRAVSMVHSIKVSYWPQKSWNAAFFGKNHKRVIFLKSTDGGTIWQVLFRRQTSRHEIKSILFGTYSLLLQARQTWRPGQCACQPCFCKEKILFKVFFFTQDSDGTVSKGLLWSTEEEG